MSGSNDVILPALVYSSNIISTLLIFLHDATV